VCEDVLLFANFLPAFANSKSDKKTVYELFETANTNSDGGLDANVMKSLQQKHRYIEVKVYCEDSSTGFEVPLPKIQLAC
jgi:hypothetical protein